MAKRRDIQKILIIGSGPIVIIPSVALREAEGQREGSAVRQGTASAVPLGMEKEVGFSR